VKLAGKIFTMYRLCKRLKSQLLSKIQIWHLRQAGAAIGSNVVIKEGAVISYCHGSFLQIGDNVTIDMGAEIFIEKGGALTIGDRCYIGKRTVISTSEKIEIGANCAIAHQVTILDINKKYQNVKTNIMDQGWQTKPIAIADDVWIATGVVILAGSTLGPHTVVAANSVVNDKHVGHEILAGIPATRKIEIKGDSQ